MLACLCPNGPNRYDGAAPPSLLLVATAGGIGMLQREAPGRDWCLAGTMLPGVHATTLATVSTGIFAGSHGDGIFFSADGGKDWEPCNEGMTARDVYCLAAVEQDGRATLYAGTEPAALFRSRDLGRTWLE